MGGKSVQKWLSLVLATCSLAAVSGGRPVSRADDAPNDGVAEARDLVKSLEERLQATQEDLGRAKKLLTKLEQAHQTGDDTASLDGVWRIVGIDGNRKGGQFVKPPYDEYKIMSAGHYLWLSFDPTSGAIRRSGGGSYTLKAGVYKAHVDYSMAQDLRGVVGQDYGGTCRLEGKKLYQDGTMPNGAVFDELWERVH